MGLVSRGLEMECSSLHRRVILVYFRTLKYDFCIDSCGKCWKSVPYLQYRYTPFTTMAAYRKRTNQAREIPWTNIQSRHFTLDEKKTGLVRLCYYTMEMRPFLYQFGKGMNSIRSYIHSLIRHTSTDWIGRFHVISKRNAVECTDGLDFVELYKYLTAPWKCAFVSRYRLPMQSLPLCFFNHTMGMGPFQLTI